MILYLSLDRFILSFDRNYLFLLSLGHSKILIGVALHRLVKQGLNLRHFLSNAERLPTPVSRSHVPFNEVANIVVQYTNNYFIQPIGLMPALRILFLIPKF